MKKSRLLLLLVIFVIAAFFLFLNRVSIKQILELWWRREILPPPISVNSSSTIQQFNNATMKKIGEKKMLQNNKEVSEFTLPSEINLAVPFVSQAPFKNWDAEHEETCEEASVLMINGFYKKEKYTRQQMEDELQKIVDWEMDNFGFFKDTTAEQTVRMMKGIYNLNAIAKYDVTIEDIKKELAVGRPVIVPAAGKLLPNPYFSNGGPLYHMLVVKGYTKDGKFITNDPGTNTLGENFTYKFEALYNAMHDWVQNGNILTGRKTMIVVE